MELNSKPRQFGSYLNPYIIAEIGVNHAGSMELAKKMILDCAESGAHAAKFQTYKAKYLASKNSPSYWDLKKEPTKSQFELFKKYDKFEEKDYIELESYCQKVGIDFLSTPFDEKSIESLSSLVHVFKIASADITNVPLIRKMMSYQKPIILSTGASTLAEIEECKRMIKSQGIDLALLHCVLNYPTRYSKANLGCITLYKRVFQDCTIGYSDHTIPDENMTSLQLAAILGATIIEKHFTYDKTIQGNDHYHAMDKKDLSIFTKILKSLKDLHGTGNKDIQDELSARKNARRSIVASCQIRAGETLQETNITTKRPGIGISPIYWDEIIGKIAAVDIDEDDIIQWNQLQ